MGSNRRQFITKSIVLGLGSTTAASAALSEMGSNPAPDYFSARGPIVISSRNGTRAVRRALEEIESGADALDAVVAGVSLVEEDPEDTSVGLGGLPNADGVVQLDASVMHGPSGRAGGVAALEGIVHASRVALKVLRRSDHVLLVGKGAQEFARMHGFPIQDLMTERSRRRWLRWKENLSTDDEYLPEHSFDDATIGQVEGWNERHWGTINCCAMDLNGNISGVTTTSGLAFKIPGRVGDSPIIGAGLYVDNDVGAAGSTGRGEANLESLASFLIVERMRAGDTPEEACLFAVKRIASRTKPAYLLDEQGRPRFNVQFYALRRDGLIGGAEIWGGRGQFAVADRDGARLVPLAYLFEAS